MKKKDKVKTLKTCIYTLHTKREQNNDNTHLLHQVGSGGHNKSYQYQMRSEVRWTSSNKMGTLSETRQKST